MAWRLKFKDRFFEWYAAASSVWAEGMPAQLVFRLFGETLGDLLSAHRDTCPPDSDVEWSSS